MRPTARRGAVAIVPMKGFDRAKGRLMATLTPGQRRMLVSEMYRHVSSVVVALPWVERLLIATDSAEVGRLMAGVATEIVIDSGPGPLGGVLADALRRADVAPETPLLICMADLPLLGTQDLARMWALLSDNDVVCAPDAELAGTNALLLAGCFPDALRFGSGDSFADHLAEAERREWRVATVVSPGTALDLDRPEDLARVERPARQPPQPRADRRGGS